MKKLFLLLIKILDWSSLLMTIQIIIKNNWIKDKFEAMNNESISEDWNICKIRTDKVEGVDGAKSKDISTTDDENEMIINITSLIFL